MMSKKSIISLLAIVTASLASTPIVAADITGYVTSESGQVWRNADGQCYRTQFWEKKDAIAACEPADMLDTDKDGITNNIDQCPDNVAGVEVDKQGCELDTDKDGLVNRLDSCPNSLVDAKVDNVGCQIVELDSDGDTVADSLDLCSGSAPGAIVNSSGCEFDSDGDGITDSKDQCFNTAINRKVDERGCNFVEKVVMKSVTFDSDSDSLKDSSAEALDRVADKIKQHPGMIIEIAGYSDSQGADHYNKALSEKRAHTVNQYLTSRGVPAINIQAKGYGVESPIADNATETGRAQNRRVEFRVIQHPSTQDFQFVLEP